MGSLAFGLVGAIGLPRPVGITGSVVFFFALFGAGIVADVLIQSRRRLHELELEQEVTRLDELLALIRRRERLVRRRLAFVLHGSLQGALHAAALKITEASEIDQGVVEGIRLDLAVALSFLDGSPRAGDSTRTSETIDELTSVWDGSRQVTASLDHATEQALAADADADEAIAEVIREAVNNAFRHGKAGIVEIEVVMSTGLSPAGSRQIAISVRDDGSGYPVESTPGLGSALLDELCNSWSLVNEEGCTFLRAIVALSPRAGTAHDPGDPATPGDSFVVNADPTEAPVR